MRKPMTVVSCILLAVTILTVSNAHAQYPWFGIHGAALFPSGDFEDRADNGYGGGFEIGAYVNPNVVVKAMASYHGFGSQSILGQELDGAYIPLEVGANFYLGFPGMVRPYISAHGGWFVASGDFEESAFGMGGGMGLEFPLGSPGSSMFIEPNYNIVFQDGDNEEYFGVKVGLVFSLSPPSPIDRSQRR